MKIFVVFTLLAIFDIAIAEVKTRLVDLKVDHFNPLDRRTFDARYFVNSDFWIPGGPIFIYLSGPTGDHDEFLTSGAVFEIARETNSHLFSLEHRYFGESRPTENTSVENLRHLSIEQTLADLAEFIAFVKSNYYGTADARVVLWGRGYGGSLAVWARQKYPNHVNAVWASSAPINAVFDNSQFMSNAFYTINSIGGPECGDIIRGAFRMIEDGIRLRNTSYVEERLRFCSPVDIDIEEDIARLYYSIANEIGSYFVSNAVYPEVDDKCTIMRGLDTPNDLPVNDLDAFARWFTDDYGRDLECWNNNHTSVSSRYQNIEWDSISQTGGFRQTLWLHCTQLGQFSIANEGENHPFGWRFDGNFFRQLCARSFDQEIFTQDFIETSIARTNNLYGGLAPNVYRVFFTHGEMDPRRTLGPTVDLNENAPVVIMSLQSSGRDFGSPSSTDYEVLLQTKARARELIIKWIFDSIEEDLPTQPPPIPI